MDNILCNSFIKIKKIKHKIYYFTINVQTVYQNYNIENIFCLFPRQRFLFITVINFIEYKIGQKLKSDLYNKTISKCLNVFYSIVSIISGHILNLT